MSRSARRAALRGIGLFRPRITGGDACEAGLAGGAGVCLARWDFQRDFMGIHED